jgi:hypothetical protein
MKDKVLNSISLIGGASILFSAIICILIIWVDDKYKCVLFKLLGTCIIIFFFCWLVTPTAESEFEEED